MSSLIFVMLLIAPIFSQTDVECNQAFQCVNQSHLIGDYTMTIGGYKSHIGPLSVISANTVTCKAAFACSRSASISADACYCDGTNACSSSHIDALFLYGRGVNALRYSTISPSVAMCYGEQSCAYSVIKGPQRIDGYAAYSLLNATIDSANGGGIMDIYLYGHYSGFRTRIICRSGHNCNIHCAANACTNIYIDCKGNCALNKVSDDTVTSSNDIIDIESVWAYDSSITVMNNDDLCSSSIGTMNFDNYREKRLESDIVSDDISPLCCRGRQSCAEITNIIDHTSANHEPIICSGGHSCIHSEFHGTGSVFCGAHESCSASLDIQTTDVLYCTGYQSCSSSDINKASDVYCTGFEACLRTSITSNGFDINIYLLGHNSGEDATILCSASDTCSIYCMGYQSCLNLKCNGLCMVCCDKDSVCPDGYAASPCVIRQLQQTSNPSALTTSAPQTIISTSGTPIISTSFNPSVFPSTMSSTSGSAVPYNPSSIVSDNPSSNLNTQNGTTIHLAITVPYSSTLTNITPSYIVSGNITTEKQNYTKLLSILFGILLSAAIVCGFSVLYCLRQNRKENESKHNNSQNMKQRSASHSVDEVQNDDNVSEIHLPRVRSNDELWGDYTVKKEGVMDSTADTTVRSESNAEKAICTDCGLRKIGEFNKSSGLFYCFDCRMYYTNDGEEGQQNHIHNEINHTKTEVDICNSGACDTLDGV